MYYCGSLPIFPQRNRRLPALNLANLVDVKRTEFIESYRLRPIIEALHRLCKLKLPVDEILSYVMVSWRTHGTGFIMSCTVTMQTD